MQSRNSMEKIFYPENKSEKKEKIQEQLENITKRANRAFRLLTFSVLSFVWFSHPVQAQENTTGPREKFLEKEMSAEDSSHIKEIEEQREWLIEYINSPKYFERL